MHSSVDFFLVEFTFIDQKLLIILVFFQSFFKGYGKELKKEGRGDTHHKKGLLSRSSFLIQKLCALLCKIMKADKTSEEYELLRRELPVAYQENWLPLLGSCALFVIALWTGRRGKEGLLTLKKTAFSKVYDDDTETWAYEKVVGELSKNNQDTDENLENGGCISFETMKESGKKRGKILTAS